ncbi:MAG: hypothetical protein U0736_13520 [Gemmataceae bacterium]
MPLRARDLTYDVRQKLLDHVRKQLGDAQYFQAVMAVGEDELLDVFLEQLPPAGATPTKQPTLTPGQRFAGTVVWCAILSGLVCWYAWWADTLDFKEGWPYAATAPLYVLWFAALTGFGILWGLSLVGNALDVPLLGILLVIVACGFAIWTCWQALPGMANHFFWPTAGLCGLASFCLACKNWPSGK